MKMHHGFHKYTFGLHVGFYPLGAHGKYLDIFLPFTHITISWGVRND